MANVIWGPLSSDNRTLSSIPMEEEDTEDSNLTLQQDSAKLITELKTSVPLFLYKSATAPDQARIRRLVKRSNTARLERLINTFQEWPQLLDPALRVVVEPLVSAFSKYNDRYPQICPPYSVNDVEPLSRAICRLLYTLCKVRGAKIIVNFLNNEPSFLEPMLDAFEKWNSGKDTTESDSLPGSCGLLWEEKYIMLLWLSHLTRTPFPLASISSSGSEIEPSISIPFEIPAGLPNVARRLLALGLSHIQSVTKEQEAATFLWTRLCTRPDMRLLRLHHTCVDWAFQSLKRIRDADEHISIYSYVGILSFLAGYFKICDSDSIISSLAPVLSYTQDTVMSRTKNANMINGSAAVRKLIIKIYRSFALHVLLLPADTPTDQSDVLDTLFNHLLASIGDKNNLVRFAASKALSLIAQKLDLDMLTQLVDTITEQLQDNVIIKSPETDKQIFPPIVLSQTWHQMDFSNADSSQWQGLILTLSHLLFRRSIPQRRLTAVVGHILKGLDFEQRSSIGVSVGSGVRDAACFGLWSLARKYSTRELLRVAAMSVRSKRSTQQPSSVFEVLAPELVLTATLDPEGNVRRAASAALQELVGRHPDTVPAGIVLVQVVDYQAVGLRYRAMHDTTLQVRNLDSLYLYAISDGLLSWRAINSPELGIRRHSADVISSVGYSHGFEPLLPLWRQLNSRKSRTLDEWHGLYLALAATFCGKNPPFHYRNRILKNLHISDQTLCLLDEKAPITIDDVKAPGKNAHLAADALGTLISLIDNRTPFGLEIDLLQYHVSVAMTSLIRCPEGTHAALFDTPLALFNQFNEQGQKDFINTWLTELESCATIRQNPVVKAAWIAAFGEILSGGTRWLDAAMDKVQQKVEDVLISHLSSQSPWQVKVAALKYQYKRVYLNCHHRGRNVWSLNDALLGCLSDYSVINAKDVGSNVRIQAIKTIEDFDDLSTWYVKQRVEIFARVYSLATEKLDKVRDSAWSCIRKFPDPVFPVIQISDIVLTKMTPMTTSSSDYFRVMLAFWNHAEFQYQILEGLITSASIGNATLVVASRTAIMQSLQGFPEAMESLYMHLLRIIRAHAPDGRLARPGLEVLAFLLDVDTVPRLTDSATEWEEFLDTTDIFYNGSNIGILEVVVRIYAGLARYDNLRSIAMRKLFQFLFHRYPKIRLATAAALYVIEPNDKLKALDLSASVLKLRRQVTEIYRESGSQEGARA